MPYSMLEDKAFLKKEKLKKQKTEKLLKKTLFKERKNKQKGLEKITTINPFIKQFVLPKI